MQRKTSSIPPLSSTDDANKSKFAGKFKRGRFGVVEKGGFGEEDNESSNPLLLKASSGSFNNSKSDTKYNSSNKDDDDDIDSEDEVRILIGDDLGLPEEVKIEVARKQDPRRDDAFHFDPDEAYAKECGYWLYKCLRGNSTGRRMKRDVFYYGMYGFVCGSVLAFVAYQEGDGLSWSNYIGKANYGLSILRGTWLTAVPALMLSSVSFFATRYWSSLVTNLVLLRTLTMGYIYASVLMFFFTLYTTCVLFQTFSFICRIEDWQSTTELSSIYPLFCVTACFIIPYLLAQFYYILNIHYLLDEMAYGGEMNEPEYDPNYVDLSNVTLTGIFWTMITVPLILGLQLYDILMALYRRIIAYINNIKPKEDPQRKKYNCCIRIFTTLWKFACKCILFCKVLSAKRFAGKSTVVPSPGDESGTKTISSLENRLQGLEAGKEEMDRLERERLEKEKKRQDEILALKKKQEEEERIKAEKKAKEEEERRRLEAEKLAEEEARKEREKKMPTLDVNNFKLLWTQLGTAGSFQCKLKSMPTLQGFNEHIKKQGFHVVFATSPSPDDIEVGICNVLGEEGGPRFLARFLASKNNFSAVMKCESVDAVTQFVKKFSLSKVLKIDTSAAK